MKSTTLFVFSALVLLSSCNEKHDRNKGRSNWVDKVANKDHGPLREKEFNGNFDEIEVSQAIDAEIIKSDKERVVISAPENIINEILVDMDGEKLHIHYKPGIRVMNSHKVTAKIYAKDFTKLVANSAGEIHVKDKFTQDKTEVDVSSAGKITGNLEANDLDISVNSSADFRGKVWAVNLDVEAASAASIDVSGKAKNADFDSSSGSSISAKEVIVDHLSADASSGASIEASATSRVDAEASSGGSVNIYKKGNVVVNKQQNSGGSVNVH
ncbi:head GIN domain-containing protein [uncultured Chryseobacterium sp.]|uniref:head GIN domain-containing protein n=1 Tax=uncultured Chryseobacterium sp. TaxID=259322 RepID=UPI00260BDB58|nr:head GIN domain-containing protein [uncultured Chryseobacterium sp.]